MYVVHISEYNNTQWLSKSKGPNQSLLSGFNHASAGAGITVPSIMMFSYKGETLGDM
jgi:hypothetical protein